MTVTVACDCGGVSITVPAIPVEVNACHCHWCRSSGALWAYWPKDVPQAQGATTTYRRDKKRIDFHHCATCRQLVYWAPAVPKIAWMGVNFALVDPALTDPIPREVQDA